MKIISIGIREQVIPVSLTLVILFILVFVLYWEIRILNLITPADILLNIRSSDILVGLTIYLKTSIDFAIFMGNLMRANPGWKNRIAIEAGTAIGNAGGTIIILAIWSFFKDINILLAIMIIIASLVLFKLAEEGLDHAQKLFNQSDAGYQKIISLFALYLKKLNSLFSPLLTKVIPNISMKSKTAKSLKKLLAFSFTVPFILGLDDFAGYVPLFNIVNVFGFAIGVMAGHTVLNIFLFLDPDKTISIVKNPLISFFGSLAFIGLALWGVYEGIILLLH